jgi:hypothetical protein
MNQISAQYGTIIFCRGPKLYADHRAQDLYQLDVVVVVNGGGGRVVSGTVACDDLAAQGYWDGDFQLMANWLAEATDAQAAAYQAQQGVLVEAVAAIDSFAKRF